MCTFMHLNTEKNFLHKVHVKKVVESVQRDDGMWEIWWKVERVNAIFDIEHLLEAKEFVKLLF